MCEIFPEVDNCCCLVSVRVGMIFIAVLSITTGAVTLAYVEQRTGVGYDKVLNMYDNATKVHNPDQAISQLSNMVSALVTFMSVVFMLAGVVLLLANFSDQEGLVQIFVWAIFLNIVIGSVLVLLITLECIMVPACLLDMDWLTGSAVIILMVFYLVLWFYFITVANSYVLNGA